MRQRFKICDDTPYVGKNKQSFVFGLIITKESTDLFEKKNRIYHRSVFIHTRSIDDWEVTLFEKYETQKQLRERETVWEHKFKTFYPLGLNEKGEYLF